MAERRVFRIACAQVNCAVGDMAGNSRLIERFTLSAKKAGADIVLFPELALTGYPPEDLLLKPSFIRANLSATERLSRCITGITAVIGFVDREDGRLYNAAAVIADGAIKAVYHKMRLPNYGVFDEKRYFGAGDNPLVFMMGGCAFGVAICEDMWVEGGPVAEAVRAGAGCILSINASPYHCGKGGERDALIAGHARQHKVPVAYVNLVGGQDELVFDGQSMVAGPAGMILGRAGAFREELLVADIEVAGCGRAARWVAAGSCTAGEKPPLPEIACPRMGREEEVYSALSLGVRDYVAKNGFTKAVLGLSGGVDSALVAAIARDALGKENVTAVFMPSRYSSRESDEDARLLAKNLGIDFLNVPIEQVFKMFLLTLEPHFNGRPRDIAEENLQARIRGTLLMAFSNKFGWLVLTTGNKSEMSTGYATLYGDMAGGLAVIKDVPKMLVYDLCRWRNSRTPVIPERILTRPPTAELRPDQKDTDSLPPYESLDTILRAYVEEDRHYDEVVGMGFGEQTVRKVFSLVDKSEYKRRQSPPGIKITPRAFGKDRRMPITCRYPGWREKE